MNTNQDANVNHGSFWAIVGTVSWIVSFEQHLLLSLQILAAGFAAFTGLIFAIKAWRGRNK